MMASPEKRRKRDHGHDAGKTSGGSKYIKLTVEKESEWPVALVVAPGLDYVFENSMDVYSQARVIAGRKMQREILLHSGEHPKLDFVAREEEAGDTDTLSQQYIAVHDPKTGDTQIIPARKLVLRATAQSARTRKGNKEDDAAKKTALESRTMLGEAFGTKKSLKALRSAQQNAITPNETKHDAKGKIILEDAAGMVVDFMGEKVSIMPTKEARQQVLDESRPRPKPNLEADTPSAVYRLEGMFDPDILQILNVGLWESAVKKGKAIETHSRFVSYRLVNVVREGSKGKLQALRLLLVLIEWRNSFKAGRRDTLILPKDEDLKTAISDYNPNLLAKLNRKFTPENTLSQWHVDNLYTHICALTLIVDNYATDIFEIRQDLGLEKQKMTQYYKELGCRVGPPKENEFKEYRIKTKAEAHNHTIAKLRIPLSFPKMRTVPRRR